MHKVNLAESFEQITEFWRPKVVGELNGQAVKLARLKGTFVWHHHDQADELFLCVGGRMRVDLEDESVVLNPGDLVIVPRGVEHRTHADEEAEVLVFVPVSTRNTGNVYDPKLTAPSDQQL